MNNSSECLFKVKWTNFRGQKVPYLLQNNDGECPLICFANVLLLRRKLELSKDLGAITFKSLCVFISSLLPHASPEWVTSVLETLKSGLLFNCKFDSTRAYIDPDPEQLFLSFNIPIKHGWIPDPIIYGPLTNLNYDQLLEMLAIFQSEKEVSSFEELGPDDSEHEDKVENNHENQHDDGSKLDESKLEEHLKNLKLSNADEGDKSVSLNKKVNNVKPEQVDGDKSEPVEEKINTKEEKKEDKGENKSEIDEYVANLAMEFLETYATQITEYGMRVLREEIPEGSLVALYRNNHFLVATCNRGQLFTLITDSAFYGHRCVWESLESCEYFDENFNHYTQTSREEKPKKVRFIDKVKRVFRRKNRR
ncbi:hypothetical protein TpMuguga_02g00489 [Theileria parva strain Muguga]|uniref:MINDY deubiquitinase domain-containing protein n=1 Tax=Theileria parva TaxID=5875 RepID=Q4N501_THEPA|nr:uncharacterized protein TpMuguga_02g00489 [Theileria parva strain Muguga]EAN32772.1 hypothetical protein TpMuguga_02g00489 [Theileria parva strain Muguga]|eukprot:XP_765055.1 hypothetical protein [Theileria parva strain Muguga]